MREVRELWLMVFVFVILGNLLSVSCQSAVPCTEEEAAQCHFLANCNNGMCSCAEGFVGSGYGDDGCMESVPCTEEEAAQCHFLANCNNGMCSCAEGFVGSGYGEDGCKEDCGAWGNRAVMHCSLESTWPELAPRFSRSTSPPSAWTGGLGRLLREDYAVWVCVNNHPCGPTTVGNQQAIFCFVYNEDHEHFVPWGTNSCLQLVPPGEGLLEA